MPSKPGLALIAFCYLKKTLIVCAALLFFSTCLSSNSGPSGKSRKTLMTGLEIKDKGGPNGQWTDIKLITRNCGQMPKWTIQGHGQLKMVCMPVFWDFAALRNYRCGQPVPNVEAPGNSRALPSEWGLMPGSPGSKELPGCAAV